MMILLLIVTPLLFGAAAWLSKSDRVRCTALLSGAVCHFLLTLALLHCPQCAACRDFAPQWLKLDSVGMIFLLITSLLFLAVSVHTVRWLPAERKAKESAERPDRVLSLRIFIPSLLAFLSTMTLVICARDFGLLWVAVEATTLFSAPLILFHRSTHSLEAMWKYLLICSVGIGLALFGTMMLAVSGKAASLALNFDQLMAAHNSLDPRWFKAAFILILAGYGTKMGLAPFHTWLPDAHSEAPGTVSALLSGALLNCSFLGIIRFHQIVPDSLHSFTAPLLTALGLLSLATAAFFIIRQSDYKRMLAYSSVEHMGLLAIFLGAGALNGGMLHLCGHSLIKMSLFLIAGNFLLAAGTRRISDVGGLSRILPRNAALWIAGTLMICGMPPSPLFFTEFSLLFHLHFGVAAAVLILLFFIFAGMTGIAFRMVMGEPGSAAIPGEQKCAAEKLWQIPALMLTAALAGGAFLLWMLCGKGGLF